MRTITKEYTLYNYNDVIADAELKDKIIKKHQDINVDFEWYDGILYGWKQKLTEIGFMNPEINFSGFWSQGDGASFTCDYIDIKKMAEYSKEFTQREVNVLYALWNYGYIEAKISRNTHHYYHKYTITNEFYDGAMPVRYKHLQKLVDELRTYIDSIILYLCDDIYQELEDNYDYLTSEAAILETIEANDYEFYENGDIA